MKTLARPGKSTAAASDLCLVIVFALAVLVLAVRFDLFHGFDRWYSGQDNPGCVQKITAVFFLLPVALGIFSYRRWREVRHEIAGRQRMEDRQRKELEMRNLLLWLHEEAPLLSEKEVYDHVLEQTVLLTGSTIGFFHLVSDDQRDIILTAWNR